MPEARGPDKQPSKSKANLSNEGANGATHAAPTPLVAKDPIDARARRRERAEAEADEARAKGEFTDTSRQRGGGVIDPRDAYTEAPQYLPGQLPGVYENYFKDCIASWGGDPSAYACSFIAMHCAAMHSSVKVQTNPLKRDNFRNPNDFSLTLGKSGKAKSGMFKDLTRVFDEWQTSMDKRLQPVKGKSREHPPMMFLQTASTEGMLRQIADNKGERLVMGCEEAMNFYTGAGAHHGENGVSLMSDAVCAAYDGGSFRKRLVNAGSYAIPECLATLIMATTFDKFAKWRSFMEVIDSGMVGRHTVGIIAQPAPKCPADVIEGAEAAMRKMLTTLRSLRNMRFVLADDARSTWLGFCQDKDKENDAMERDRVNPGLVAWCRKYDLRIMSMATILQAYEYIEGGMIDHDEVSIKAEAPTTTGEAASPNLQRTVAISKENLKRAVTFVEGYLQESQAHFYEIAQGVTEFGMELLNFLAYRVTTDDIEDPACRWIERKELVHKGPASIRAVPDVDERNEVARRWIKTLLDYGYVEPFWDHPKARQFKVARGDLDAAWYRLRGEVLEYFESDDDREWLRAHYEQSRGVRPAHGRGRGVQLR